jgi:hypothetical protein
MKKIITSLAAVAALLSGFAALPASAQEDGCANMGYLAEVIMQQRQSGMTMSDMVARAEASGEENPQILDLTRAIIIDAYSRPQYGSPEYQENAISEFRNAVELACYQNM